MSLYVDIEKRYGKFHLKMQFESGHEVLSLLGASGCGKSLTLKCIAGIETPDRGRIVLDGRVLFDSQKGINLPPQKRKVGYLFQQYALFPNMTVLQNVEYALRLRKDKKDEARKIALETLEMIGMTEHVDKKPRQLSGGQQQRVALARMLAARPGILMLDEPFSALDSHLKSVLEQNLSGLFEIFDGTILYVSHDIDEAVRFCDRIAVMESGKIMEIDEGRELIEGPKSLAGIKLSGCKNAPLAEYVDDHHVYCPQWGVELELEQVVPKDVKAVGIRAFNIQKADGPGPGVYRMRVDRVSDSRFDRMALMEFLDRRDDADDLVAAHEQEMHYLHQRVFWRIDAGENKTEWDSLPKRGDELYVRIPTGKIYLVTK